MQRTLTILLFGALLSSSMRAQNGFTFVDMRPSTGIVSENQPDLNAYWNLTLDSQRYHVDKAYIVFFDRQPPKTIIELQRLLTSAWSASPPHFPLVMSIVEDGKYYERTYKTLADFPRHDVKCTECAQPNRWFVKWGQQ